MATKKRSALRDERAAYNREQGRLIRAAMDARGFTQAKLAVAAGLRHQSMISEALNGKRGLSTAQVAAIAAALKVDVSTLIPGAPEPEKSESLGLSDSRANVPGPTISGLTAGEFVERHAARISAPERQLLERLRTRLTTDRLPEEHWWEILDAARDVFIKRGS